MPEFADIYPDLYEEGYGTRTAIPVIPVRDLSTQDVLYGDRITTYRWEVLEHSAASGQDQLVGILDGVAEGDLRWTQNAAVKGTGKARVLDLAVAEAGKLRIGDLPLESLRVRPVCVIQGPQGRRVAGRTERDRTAWQRQPRAARDAVRRATCARAR